MKTIASIAAVASIAGAMLFTACAGSYYVSEQPVEPVYERPVAPYAGAIWIDGDWNWSGGRYIYRKGYWDKPRNGYHYSRGSWEHGSHGYRWNSGGWRK